MLRKYMNSKWVNDISKMHDQYGVNDIVQSYGPDMLKHFLDFRIKFLEEELNELKTATNADDVVDALIDQCVVAIGTLNALNVDIDKAWDRVWNANMEKQVGVKSTRPNSLGLPDLVKPEGWVAPSHADNIGLLSKLSFDNVASDRASVGILQHAIDVQRKKGQDYNGNKTSVEQADYYPRGVWSIMDIIHAKYLRMVSVLETMEQGGKANFESIEDSAIDMINYASFLAAYMQGKVPGQKPDHDVFNKPVKDNE